LRVHQHLTAWLFQTNKAEKHWIHYTLHWWTSLDRLLAQIVLLQLRSAYSDHIQEHSILQLWQEVLLELLQMECSSLQMLPLQLSQGWHIVSRDILDYRFININNRDQHRDPFKCCLFEIKLISKLSNDSLHWTENLNYWRVFFFSWSLYRMHIPRLLFSWISDCTRKLQKLTNTQNVLQRRLECWSKAGILEILSDFWQLY